MALPPLVIKLRCSTWAQVATLHERDLKRSTLYLRTAAPLPLGRELRVDIVLPSKTVVSVEGRVAHQVAGGLELVLTKLPPSAMWLIESALAKLPVPEFGAPEAQDDRESAEAERELLAALEAELRGFRGMSPYQILGIPAQATEASARAAFESLSKRYHPDRFARYESERLRLLAAEVFMVLREGYRQIATGTVGRTAGATPVRGVPFFADSVPKPLPLAETEPVRPVYSPTPVRGVPVPPPARPPVVAARSPAPTSRPLVTFSRPERPVAPPPAPSSPVPTTSASLSRLDADELFGDLDQPPAAPSPPPLVLGQPSVAAAQQLLDAGRHDDAIAEYEKALRANPTDRAARSGREVAMGLRLVAAGDKVGAAERFEAALEVEPWSERPARELASLRRGATERGRGLLAKLLGKGGT